MCQLTQNKKLLTRVPFKMSYNIWLHCKLHYNQSPYIKKTIFRSSLYNVHRLSFNSGQRFPAWKYFEENKDGGRFDCRTPTTWRGPWGLLSNVWSLVFSLFKETLIERYFIFFVIILRYWNNMKLWYKQKVTSIINTILHLSICHTFKNYRCSLRRYCFRYSEESFILFKIMLKCSCKCNILIFLLVLTKQY